MMVVFLLALLLVPYFFLTLADHGAEVHIPPALRGRIALALLFTVTGVSHFMSAEAMSEMLPDFVPYRLEIVYATGVLEFMGAAGLFVPFLIRVTGFCLILMLIGFLPVNVYAAVTRVEFGGHADGPIYLAYRVPFQFFLMWWTYKATHQKWAMFAKKAPAPAA